MLAVSSAVAQQPFITVASTTSTEESGLFGYLLPAFTKETGIQVRVVAVGTGQALQIGERGDCDVVFVHDRPAELAFVEHGFGIDRREVMYNDFILVGPSAIRCTRRRQRHQQGRDALVEGSRHRPKDNRRRLV